MRRYYHNILPGHLLIIAAVLISLVSCSTTSKLGENDVLYTGVKHLKYHRTTDSVRIDDEVKDQIFEAINVKPNNPLYSPYLRSPLPIGLWVYNHWDANSTGFKGWLYKSLVARPVLIRRVNPEARVDMINMLLRQNGYFTSSAHYELVQGSDKKKARIAYDVTVEEPYRLGNIGYLEMHTPVADIVDSLARADTYLRPGSRYCLDSLNNVRVNIANYLRNQGYYYFRPEYIQYYADSLQRPGIIDIQLTKAPDVPNLALVKYYTRDITATVKSNDLDGHPDTIALPRCTLIKWEPIRIKNNVIPSNISARPGRPFRVNSMDRTQLRLSRLGIFSNIDLQVTPLDSITPDGHGLLDLAVNCVLDKPWEVKFEVQATSKSNSFIGPGMELGLAHKNVFGAGERLKVNLTGVYEWQTGSNSSQQNTSYNSYEFGIESELAFPRLLAPRFVDRSRRYVNWTRIALKASILNRPHFFKMAQYSSSFSWEWHANKSSLNEFTPLSLTYSKLLSYTDRFEEAMMAHPALIQSFEDQLIPAMKYTYTYDNDFGRNHITWRTSVMEAGNIVGGIASAAKAKKGESGREILGTPFAQFVKGETQVVWTRHLTPASSFVGRVFLGAGYAYGNSDEMPFREQFYVGGANSVRAFAVRSIGPGSYRPDYVLDKKYYYYDMVGDFKFEANAEYRFPLFSYFKGAVFLDAGNVWLLKNDDYIEGGKLQMKNFFKELALGTGVGLRFDMSMLVVRADLGVGLHAPYDTGHRGYFNIGRFKDALALHLAIGYPF